MNEKQVSQEAAVGPGRKSHGGRNLLVGFGLGFVVCGVAVFLVMPSLMIVTHECKQGVDETITQLTDAAQAQGWVVSTTMNMNKSLAQHDVAFEPKVQVLKICQPQYAESVLSSDREVSCLMPCSIAVYEGDDGKTYLSKMNVGLMGKMFGGNVAQVMGTEVARDEQQILAGLLKE